MFILGVPQLVYLSLVFVGLGGEAALHGKPKTGHHSFWVALVGAGSALSLLYWGGFFG